MKEKVLEVVKQLIKNESKLNLKGFCGLKESIEGKMETVGWIELNNHFMFFIDKKIYHDVISLFGLEKNIEG